MLVKFILMKLKMIVDNVSNSLSIGSRTRTTAVDVVGNLGKFVTDSIGHISSVFIKNQLKIELKIRRKC